MTEKLKTIVTALEDKKGQDVVVLTLKQLTPITDYFIICTGTNTQQIRALYEHVESCLRDTGIKPLGIEGQRGMQWVLMDYNDVMVHLFTQETRDYYKIERLWLDAPRISIEGQGDEKNKGYKKCLDI
ncbi:MAG: ribosome silencing factor [Nitrospirae bacterium]|nr:ribosome silencing factor [Nitrospirota bacterium]